MDSSVGMPMSRILSLSSTSAICRLLMFRVLCPVFPLFRRFDVVPLVVCLELTDLDRVFAFIGMRGFLFFNNIE